MCFIILIVDNFSKFVGLYPAKNTLTLEFVKAFLSWVEIFEDPQKRWRIAILKYQHLIIVHYHPQGNSMAERRMKEVGAHLRALVYENRNKSEWSHYLPLVQRILNHTVDQLELSLES